VRFEQGAAARAAAAIAIALAAVPLLSATTAEAFFGGPDPGKIEVDSGPYLPTRVPAELGDGLGAGRGHEGADLFAPAGSPLVAVDDAVVVETGSDGGRGNYVAIFDRAANRTYNYLHMLAPAALAPGETVTAGQTLGLLGCTGSCYGDHLHFEVRRGRGANGAVIDPVPLLETLERAPRRGGFRAPRS
jgi:murein DD-endopeptidase MepM/ murein hydrolase activator NlpD